MNSEHHDEAIETLYSGQWLSMRKRGRWEYVERNNPGGAVIIIALTPEDKILFVEQYRAPIDQRTIEMPAGLVGDLEDQTDEDASLAACRELEEETGYACERIEPIHVGPSSAGMSTEMMTFVRAHGLRRTGPGGGDESEQITVHEVSRNEAGTWLMRMASEGYSIDPKLFAGLWFIEHPQPLV